MGETGGKMGSYDGNLRARIYVGNWDGGTLCTLAAHWRLSTITKLSCTEPDMPRHSPITTGWHERVWHTGARGKAPLPARNASVL